MRLHRVKKLCISISNRNRGNLNRNNEQYKEEAHESIVYNLLINKITFHNNNYSQWNMNHTRLNSIQCTFCQAHIKTLASFPFLLLYRHIKGCRLIFSTHSNYCLQVNKGSIFITNWKCERKKISFFVVQDSDTCMLIVSCWFNRENLNKLQNKLIVHGAKDYTILLGFEVDIVDITRCLGKIEQ